MTQTRVLRKGVMGVGSRYVRERENAAPAFLPSGKGHGGAAPVSRNGPRRFCRLSSPIRHYFPDCWAINWSAAGAAHGNLTPPRISPSCPHYVPLWLDRCTIIGWQGLRKTACQSCFGLGGYRSATLVGRLLCGVIRTGGSWRTRRIAVPLRRGPAD